jgi:hypothetical protein
VLFTVVTYVLGSWDALSQTDVKPHIPSAVDSRWTKEVVVKDDNPKESVSEISEA